MNTPVDRRAISPEIQELREAVLELKLNQKNQDVIIATLVSDQLANTKLKAKLGGVVLTVTFALTAMGGLFYAALEFFKR
jgi:hypothetical protein